MPKDHKLAQTEEALQQSKEIFRLMVESVQDYAIFLLNPAGQIMTWNIGAERIKGYKASEVIGSHFSLFFLREDILKGKPDRELNDALKTGRVEDQGWRLRKGGGKFWAQVTVTTIKDRRGILQGFCKVTRDMTERNAAEEALQKAKENLEIKVRERTEDLVQLNKELEQFAYVASHDLQEPLRVIANYADLLSLQYKDKFDEDGMRLLSLIKDGAVRAKQLILDLLDLSVIGSISAPFTSTDLNSVLDQVLLNLKVSIDETRPEITRDPLPKVLADRVQMMQLFQNLLSNAIKYRSKEPLKIHISAKKAKNFWTLGVRDNGIGIDPQYRERIFKIFQRLHSKTEYPGTGIGLALCKKIVERHRGKICVESVPGSGSTFYFTLPSK